MTVWSNERLSLKCLDRYTLQNYWVRIDQVWVNKALNDGLTLQWRGRNHPYILFCLFLKVKYLRLSSSQQLFTAFFLGKPEAFSGLTRCIFPPAGSLSTLGSLTVWKYPQHPQQEVPRRPFRHQGAVALLQASSGCLSFISNAEPTHTTREKLMLLLTQYCVGYILTQSGQPLTLWFLQSSSVL